MKGNAKQIYRTEYRLAMITNLVLIVLMKIVLFYKGIENSYKSLQSKNSE